MTTVRPGFGWHTRKQMKMHKRNGFHQCLSSAFHVVSALCVFNGWRVFFARFRFRVSSKIHAWTFNESASSPFTPGQIKKRSCQKRRECACTYASTFRSKTLTPFTKQQKPINDQKKDNGEEIWSNRKRHFYRKRREWIIKQQKSGTEHCATSFVITFEFLFHHSIYYNSLIGIIILSIASRLLNARTQTTTDLLKSTICVSRWIDYEKKFERKNKSIISRNLHEVRMFAE